MVPWQKPEADPNDGFLLADGGLFGNDPTVPAILYTLFTKEHFLGETPPEKPIDNLKNIVVLSIATGMIRGKKSAQDMVRMRERERERERKGRGRAGQISLDNFFPCLLCCRTTDWIIEPASDGGFQVKREKSARYSSCLI